MAKSSELHKKTALEIKLDILQAMTDILLELQEERTVTNLQRYDHHLKMEFLVKVYNRILEVAFIK